MKFTVTAEAGELRYDLKALNHNEMDALRRGLIIAYASGKFVSKDEEYHGIQIIGAINMILPQIA